MRPNLSLRGSNRDPGCPGPNRCGRNLRDANRCSLNLPGLKLPGLKLPALNLPSLNRSSSIARPRCRHSRQGPILSRDRCRGLRPRSRGRRRHPNSAASPNRRCGSLTRRCQKLRLSAGRPHCRRRNQRRVRGPLARWSEQFDTLSGRIARGHDPSQLRLSLRRRRQLMFRAGHLSRRRGSLLRLPSRSPSHRRPDSLLRLPRPRPSHRRPVWLWFRSPIRSGGSIF